MMKLGSLWVLIAVLGLKPMLAEGVQENERDVKAALIYNFAVYTTRPEYKENTFNICVFDEDQENLNRNILESKQVNGKPIHYEVIHSFSDVKKCQVLYLEDSRNKDNKLLLGMLVNLSVLSIEDITAREDDVGMIKIHLDDKRYHFTINNEAAKRSNLIFSSQLLRLATKVY